MAEAGSREEKWTGVATNARDRSLGALASSGMLGSNVGPGKLRDLGTFGVLESLELGGSGVGLKASRGLGKQSRNIYYATSNVGSHNFRLHRHMLQYASMQMHIVASTLFD
eukprot:385644-Pyramimonas_sp.AAC.1